MLESAIERSIVNWCNKRGVLCLKLQAPKKGFPDRTVFVNGSVGFVEIKKPGGVVSDHQKYWIGKLNGRGYPSAVVYSLEEFSDFISQFH